METLFTVKKLRFYNMNKIWLNICLKNYVSVFEYWKNRLYIKKNRTIVALFTIVVIVYFSVRINLNWIFLLFTDPFNHETTLLFWETVWQTGSSKILMFTTTKQSKVSGKKNPGRDWLIDWFHHHHPPPPPQINSHGLDCLICFFVIMIFSKNQGR